jgi:sporulation protein YlmC with PRC-barrel domain
MHTSRLVALAFAAASASAPLAVRAADVESLPVGSARQGQSAQQCLTDLRAFEDDLARVGFGALAPSGYGMGYTGYGTAYGLSGTPRQKMQSFRDAAYVYGFDGNEQSCQTVLASMRQIFQEHQKLVGLESGDPNAQRAWRRAHLAQATPVTEMDRLMRAKTVIGADIRTSADVKLGEIKDIVLDPARQGIAYVLASRGGFLGLGEELVAVRWFDLRATTDHEIYVLDASAEAFAAAPKIERGSFEQTSGENWRRTLDQYWAGVVGKP